MEVRMFTWYNPIHSVVWLALMMIFVGNSSAAPPVSTDDLYQITFDSYSDLIANKPSSAGYSNYILPSGYHVGGMIYKYDVPTGYFMIRETNVDDVSGTEIKLTSFQGYDYFIGGFVSGGYHPPLDVNAGLDVVAFIYDGKFHLIMESNTDTSGGSEVLYFTYDTFSDLIASTLSTWGYSAIDVNAAFDVAGLAYDGSQYHLLLESNIDKPGGKELYKITYNSFADFLTNTQASAGYLIINIKPVRDVVGFLYDGKYRLILEEPRQPAILKYIPPILSAIQAKKK